MDLAVVHTHAYDCLHLFLCKRKQAGIIITLVCTADNPYHRPCLALECIPCSIHIGCFGVIYIEYVADTEHFLESVLNGLECRKTVSDGFVVYIHHLCCNGSSHRVVYIVSSSEGKFLKEHVALFFLVSHDKSVVLQESSLFNFCLLRERQLLSLYYNLVKMIDCYLVIRAEDETVFA